MSLIILWNNRTDNWLKQRLRAVGRMALTNYLAQTVIGVLVFTSLLGDLDFVNRTQFWCLCSQYGTCSYGGRRRG